MNWDPALNAYENSFRGVSTFNTNGDLIEWLGMEWVSATGTWNKYSLY